MAFAGEGMPFDTAKLRKSGAPPPPTQTAPHSWISSPGANGWQDGMMAYFGQLLVANIYLLGPLASRMCRSSVWLCALYEKITFAILST